MACEKANDLGVKTGLTVVHLRAFGVSDFEGSFSADIGASGTQAVAGFERAVATWARSGGAVGEVVGEAVGAAGVGEVLGVLEGSRCWPLGSSFHREDTFLEVRAAFGGDDASGAGVEAADSAVGVDHSAGAPAGRSLVVGTFLFGAIESGHVVTGTLG